MDIHFDKTAETKRNSVLFNVGPLFEREFSNDLQESNKTKTDRLIRDKAVFFYITAPNFKNVYLFRQGDGLLALSNTITISADIRMVDTIFNQHDTYFEIVNGT